MHTRVLLLGDPEARPAGLERSLIRSGFALSESVSLPATPGDAGSPDFAILAVAGLTDQGDRDLLPLLSEAWRNTPTIVLLPEGGAEAAGRALAAGAVDAMVAPVHLPELVARIVARLRGVRDGFRAASSNNGQAQLFAVFQEVALATRPEEMLQILVRRIALSLGAAHAACIFSVDNRRGRIVAVAERPEVKSVEIDLAEYPEVQHAAATERTAYLPDGVHHPLLAGVPLPGLAPFQASSAVAVPITFQGKGLGFLVLRTAGTSPSLTADDLAFVETLVTATSRLLEHEDRRANIYRRQASAGVIDPLTGCGGLDALDRRVREEINRANRYGRRFSLLLIDIDGLRYINQQYGVGAGDRLLSELGGLLQRELRSPDFVARYGGDEFAVIMPETEGRAVAEGLARLRQAIAGYPFGEGLSETLSISAGWSSYPHPGVLAPEDLFARAEAGLAEAKRVRAPVLSVAVA